MAPVSGIAVVVVTNQGATELLHRCVSSVRAAGGADQVIVVDNSGRADTYRGAGVDELSTVANEGFGAAANHGIRTARALSGPDGGCAIALLNDDIVVTSGWLGPLRAALDADAHLGAVQPKLLLASSGRALPSAGSGTVNSVGVQVDRFGAGSDIGFGEVDGEEFVEARAIELFTGGAVLLRHEFLVDTGGFDERYFLYYEDVDLARRGTERGWRYRCDPASVVHHEYATTTSGLGDERTYYQERNRLWSAFRFESVATIGRALWLSVRRVRHRPRRAHATALIAGLAGAPRSMLDRRRARPR